MKGDRTAHDQSQRRVPVPRYIEEVPDLFRIRHSRNSKAQSEPDTCDECDDELLHDSLGRMCRTKNAANVPVAMKVSTAVKDRKEPRLSPHTP